MALNLNCPICGPRSGYEFRFGGEDKGPRPAEEGATTALWLAYAHLNRNVAGVQREWWCHKDGCGTWFRVCRDTVTNCEVPTVDTL
ncbi:sarcosine oxidase subunit delta [Desulfatitalea alkaliphila]|uniref:Sarcosine oxidase subunit delta n=1 Tax=Desulfatitalea alkaliphila TaxID=2929485 RepID=A0AA41R0G5_9BACT|nr:sarcosine oxidase subunit delta [Desulfatitalea alkaliphila]MCJ8499713.1 sarcosine oxidase subunit delta [Desulfatitalea alkaliphila]